MESMAKDDTNEDVPEVRDLPALGIQVGTLAALTVCVLAGIESGSWAWAGWAVTALLVAVSLYPKPPVAENRWNMPDALFQAIGMAAIPAGITLALTSDWRWPIVAAIVLLLSCILSSEFDKPKAAGRG